MRILFTFIGGRGHFHPLIPVARAAAQAGHTVAVAGSGTLQGVISAAGFAAYPTSQVRPPATQATGASAPLLPVDPDREERDLRENFADKGARRHVAALLDLAGTWQPDLIVRDEVDFGAGIAAERLGVPCAVVVVLAAGGFLRPDVVAAPLTRLRVEHGLSPDPDLEMQARDLVLAPFPAAFRDPAFPLPASALHFRPEPATQPRPSGRTSPTQRPGVYVTLGTVFNAESGDLFHRILAALDEVMADVVVTVGDRIDPAELGPVPDHIRLEGFVPQAELLPYADLVISHGGSGSVLSALAQGLPSLLLPMGADQPHNARRCVDLGTSLAADPVTASPESIRGSVEELLGNDSFRTAAGRLRAGFNALPGAAAALAALEQLG